MKYKVDKYQLYLSLENKELSDHTNLGEHYSFCVCVFIVSKPKKNIIFVGVGRKGVFYDIPKSEHIICMVTQMQNLSMVPICTFQICFLNLQHKTPKLIDKMNINRCMQYTTTNIDYSIDYKTAIKTFSSGY